MGKFVRLPSSIEEGHRTYRLTVRKQDVPPDARVVAGYIVENNQRARTEREERKKINPETAKRRAKVVGLLLVAFLSLQLVTATKQVSEIENVPISGSYYAVNDPSQDAWALANAYGQELMTNVGNLTRTEREERGITYSPNEQANRESKSISSQEDFSTLQGTISQNMAILANPDATQEEIASAITALKSATDQINLIVAGKETTVIESGRGFEENAKVLPDDRTENEIAVKDKIVRDFYMEYGLSLSNVEFINDLYERVQNGEEITIESIQKELDGDYVITGESAREVVREQKLRGIRAVLQHIENLFSRDKNQTPNTPQNDDGR